MANEAEINTRMKFKLGQMWDAITQAVKRNTHLAFVFILEKDDIPRGMKAQHYREAFEQFKDIFEKECRMSVPEGLHERELKERRDIAVKEIMMMVPPRYQGLPDHGFRVNAVVKTIEKCMGIR